MESGELGTVESIRSEMMAKLRDHFMNKVFTALTTVWTAANTPNNYTNMGGAITAAALQNAIERINQTTSGVKAIVGVRSALQPITGFGAFWSDGVNTEAVPSQLEEVMRTGWLGRYYGAPVIALNQEYNNPEDYTALLPSDKILLVGENVGEFITYGDVRSQEWTEMRTVPPQWNLSIYQQYGFLIDNAMGLYVIGNIS